MKVGELIAAFDPVETGRTMHEYMARLYPICRSITGDGVRQTLRILQEIVPLDVHEVPTGTPVFDWTVPKEWNVRDAYIKNSAGERVVDFKRCNLHVLNYSVPVRARMRLEALREHLFSDPEHPDWIPYRTSYYAENWGFCLSHRQLQALPEDEYEVCIDASLEDGHLTYGEYALPGETPDEVLISTHVCHPSLCNDNLSGVLVSAFLARLLSRTSPRYSYRFLYIPGTIGSITWLALNEDVVPRISHGLVLTCIGDSGNFTYKKSRRGDAEIDRVVAHVLQQRPGAPKIIEFFPYGYDERQYCSPGFDLPVGCLMRSPHGEFPQYHTSADNLDFVRPEYLAESLEVLLEVVAALETNRTYRNLNPKCEPQLGKRGLYQKIGGQRPEATRAQQMAMLWLLNLSDGRHTLLDVAERARMPIARLAETADLLVEHGLLRESKS